MAAGAPLDESLVGRIAAGFQEAVVDVLVEKTVELARRESIGTVVVTGGVAANSRLREAMVQRAHQRETALLPPKQLCTDNAAMIAAAGKIRAHEAALDNLTMNAVSRWTT